MHLCQGEIDACHVDMVWLDCVSKGEKVVDLYGSAEGDAGYNADSLQCVYRSSISSSE